MPIFATNCQIKWLTCKDLVFCLIFIVQKLNKKLKIAVSKPMKVSIFRKEHFNAAHRLFNPTWSDEKNEAIFGKCNNPNFHGHNYELIVQLKGEIDPETGYVYDMKVLSDLIKVHVLNKFDHKNLNLDTVEFKALNPSAENIAVVIWGILRAHIEQKYELIVRLYETERNYVEYDGN
jgi:6-pyruvoyltetrahydropterin/6-carboxytetrahydropterin synthase